MPKKDISLVSYGHTIYDKFIEGIKGKYIQNILAPQLIAQIPDKNDPNFSYVERGKFSAWFPLLRRFGAISLEEFRDYAIISEEQFNKYKENKIDLSKIVLAHKNSETIKEMNKANLSSKNPEIGQQNLEKSINQGKQGIPFQGFGNGLATADDYRE